MGVMRPGTYKSKKPAAYTAAASVITATVTTNATFERRRGGASLASAM